MAETRNNHVERVRRQQARKLHPAPADIGPFVWCIVALGATALAANVLTLGI